DPENVRHRPPESEACARCRQHDVVGPRRDGHDERICREGEWVDHGASILYGRISNYTAAPALGRYSMPRHLAYCTGRPTGTALAGRAARWAGRDRDGAAWSNAAECHGPAGRAAGKSARRWQLAAEPLRRGAQDR